LLGQTSGWRAGRGAENWQGRRQIRLGWRFSSGPVPTGTGQVWLDL